MIKSMPKPFENKIMSIKPIKTEKDYQDALKRMDQIFDAPKGSIESDEAEILMLLIEKYEETFFPIDAPDPIEAIKIRMEEMNLKQRDLVGVIGAKSKVSEVLNKKRKLTLDMIRKLSEALRLSATVLVREY
jgi:HTH-type transcriptional regulator/antitoxin HigA